MSDKEQNKKPIEIIFAPGCFDNFDGTQEELDAMIEEIKEAFASGEAFSKAVAYDIEDLIDTTDPQEIEEIVNQMTSPRTLQ